MDTTTDQANVATMDVDLYASDTPTDVEVPFDTGSEKPAPAAADPTDGQHLVTCKAVYASVDDDKTSLSVLFTEEESGKSAQINFNTLKWDDTAPNKRGGKGAFVTDLETEAAVKGKIQEMFGCSFDDIVASGMAVSGKEFKCYFDGEKGSLYPIKKFINFERSLDTLTQNILKRDYSMKDIELLPVGEWVGHRFTFGFAAEINGVVKNIRISQFEKPSEDVSQADTIVGVKYDNTKPATEMQNLINNMVNKDHLPEDSPQVKAAREHLKAIVMANRPNTVKALNEIGIDVEALIESGDRITIHGFEVIKFNDTAFIKAFV